MRMPKEYVYIHLFPMCLSLPTVTVTPAPSVTWYHEDEIIAGSRKYHTTQQEPGIFNLDIDHVELTDQVGAAAKLRLQLLLSCCLVMFLCLSFIIYARHKGH